MANARQLVDNLAALVKPGLQIGKSLPDPNSVTSIDAQSGVGTLRAKPGGGGSTSFPLTEADAGTRAYWTATTVYSTDGIFAYSVQALKTLNMTDADSAAAVLNFADPYA